MRLPYNAVLCRWARAALREYDRVSGGGLIEKETIPLVMASLAHLADQEGDSGEKRLAEALKLYLEEKEQA